MKASVIIPTSQAARTLPRLLEALRRQGLTPLEIIVVDSSSTDGTADVAGRLGCTVTSVARSRFDHGGNRNLGARRARGEALVFMTQDALPADDGFLEALTRPLRDGSAAAAYARQLPCPDAVPTEAFARSFNYPRRSQVRTIHDLPRMGIRTFFMSDVASAVARGPFEALGGFTEGRIVNEDMLLCARLLRSGRSVAYQAEAMVYHSYNYALMETFRRYFDIGVFLDQAREALAGAALAGEGMRFAAEQLRFLARQGAWAWVPRAVAENVLKCAATALGRCHRCLPRALSRRLSGRREYWSG